MQRPHSCLTYSLWKNIHKEGFLSPLRSANSTKYKRIFLYLTLNQFITGIGKNKIFMKNSMKLFGFFFLALTLSLMSCKGEDGSIGPAGAAGTNGVDGADGQDGRDGADGNANIITSDWFAPDWSSTNSTFGGSNQEAPEITQEVLDKAAIFVYSRESGSTVYLVPYSFNATTTVNMSASLSRIRVWFSSETPYTPPAGIVFRYVIIPPFGKMAPPAGANPKQHILDTFAANGIDINDFEQVTKFMKSDSEGLGK